MKLWRLQVLQTRCNEIVYIIFVFKYVIKCSEFEKTSVCEKQII